MTSRHKVTAAPREGESYEDFMKKYRETCGEPVLVDGNGYKEFWNKDAKYIITKGAHGSRKE